VALVLAAIVAVAAAVGIVVLLTGEDGPPADLAPRFAAGTSSTYRFRATDDGEPSQVSPEGTHLDLTATLDVTIRSVQDGIATAAVTVDDVEAAFNETDVLSVAVAEPQPIRFDGGGAPDHVVLMGASPDGTFFLYIDLLFPVVPRGRVAAGDPWPISFEASAPGATGRATYEGTGEMVGYADIGGVRAAEVRNELTFVYDLTVSSPRIAQLSGLGTLRRGSILLTGDGELVLTAWIDPATGTVLRAEIAGTYDLSYAFRDFDEDESGFTAGEVDSAGEFTSVLELRPQA
jgi:hypothetical protein